MKHLLYPHDQETTEEVANALGSLRKSAKTSTKISLENPALCDTTLKTDNHPEEEILSKSPDPEPKT